MYILHSTGNSCDTYSQSLFHSSYTQRIPQMPISSAQSQGWPQTNTVIYHTSDIPEIQFIWDNESDLPLFRISTNDKIMVLSLLKLWDTKTILEEAI